MTYVRFCRHLEEKLSKPSTGKKHTVDDPVSTVDTLLASATMQS